MNDYVKGEFYELIWLGIYVVLTVGIFSLAIGFGAGGFESQEVLSKNMFYIPYGVLFFIGLIICKFAGMLYFKEKEKEIEGSIIHDPEQSIFKPFRIFQNPILLIIITLIFFSVLGWLASSYQQSVIGEYFSLGFTPKYQQQFTKGADIFFSVYPASPSETMGALFLISLLGLILGIMVKKGKLNKIWFSIIFIPGGAIISMLYGIVNHILRYSSSEIAMRSVMVFWFTGGLITTLTGSIIPFLIMHDLNNFFYRFAKLFSSDIVTFITFSVIALLGFVFLIILFRKKKTKFIK